MTSANADPIKELDEELRAQYGLCPLCGKKTIAKIGERVWCKNCGWHPEPRENPHHHDA